MDTDFSAYESAVLDDNLEHSGGITVTWKSASGATMPIGQSVVYNGTKYSLLDPYTPERNDALTWRYSPKFLHPVCRLDRVPFYIEVTEQNGAKLQMSTINFTGKASTIADKLAAHFTVYGQTDGEFASTFGSWSAEMADNINTVITVSLDGCSIKAAASRIADAVGCNVFFDWNVTNGHRTIRFIAGSTIDGASYNCFHVLGGTTNMAKKSVSGILVPVTQRLQLPDRYAGSIMNYCPSGGVRLTTDIILDHIYPKLELLIKSARARYCYVTDEAGERVEDEHGHYKMYAKWYITLEYTDGKPFSMSDVAEIADKPLSLLFQPDFEHIENSSVLAGHQFELVYYDSNAEEWGIDDVEPKTNKFQVAAGEFRIIFKAEGSTILPSTDDEGLCPKEGDKVTLVNVSLSDHYTEIAQEKLEAAADSIIQMMMADSGSYRETVMGGYSLDVNQSHTVDGHSGIITDLNLNLHTGVADVTVGTWKYRKGLSGGVRDKIDSINVTTTGGNQGERGMSKAQFDALNMANPKTVVVGMKNDIDLLGTDIDAIREQEDKKFDIWFGSGVPTNSTYPASGWTTDEEKAQHVQDIYYDTDRSPASQGGRAYRYLKNGNTYGWQHITDLDTEASLEKIADVASDGVICAGAEKQRLYIDWHNCMKEYTEYSDLTEDYGIDTERTAYMNAYKALWELLNGGSAPSQSQTYISTPAWIASDALGEDTYLAEDYSGTIPEGWSIQQFYRQKWDIYYETLAALLAASDAKGQQLTEVARETAESKMQTYVSYDLPSIPYKKGDMWWKLDTQTVGNNNGTLYLCIKDSGETALMSDWTPAGKNYLDGAADFLATLAELLEKNISRKYNSSKHSVVVTWGATAPDSPAVGDVWYDSVNKAIKEYGGQDWSNVDQYEVDIPNTKNVFEALMAYDTQSDRSVTFFEDPQYASGAQTYDVCFQRAEYHDNFTNSDIEGALGIWLYDKENAWKHMKDNVSGLMENYGDHIIATIFGNEVLPSGMTSYAAGLTTYKNFAEMFAKSADPVTGALKAAAGVTVHIVTDPVTGDQQGYVDITGTFRSADGDVEIDKIENIGYSEGSHTRAQVSAITVKKHKNQSGDDVIPLEIACYEIETTVHGVTAIHYHPSIILRDEDGVFETQIGSSNIYTPSVISEDFNIQYLDSEDDTVKVLEGVGSVSSPVTFTTADGKTVTVIGGIITDVS